MHLVQLIGGLGLLNHGGAEFVPWEQTVIVCLVRVYFLLESDLEACLEQVFLQLGWRFQSVPVLPSTRHFHLLHIFRCCDRLVVHC